MIHFHRYLPLIYLGLGMLLFGFRQTEESHNLGIATSLTHKNFQVFALIDDRCSSPLTPEDALDVTQLSETNPALEDTCSTDVITKDTICSTRLTIPSLWWADEQFGDKLLENWLAYPGEKRIDLVVNRQIWGLMDYYQRYAFVHRMGTVVRDHPEFGEDGYALRVFNRQEPELCLASYTCDTSSCELDIRDFGPRSSLTYSPP